MTLSLSLKGFAVGRLIKDNVLPTIVARAWSPCQHGQDGRATKQAPPFLLAPLLLAW